MNEEAKRILKNPPTFESEHFIFRPMRLDDAEDMYEYAKDSRTTEYLLWDVHKNVEYTRKYLEYLAKAYKSGDYYDWAAVLKSENRMIGTGGFAGVDERNNVGEIGYVLSPDYWHRGFGTEIAKEMLSFGFSALGFNRIEARYIVGNKYSRAVMEKVGMTFEGILRQSMFIKGEYKDIGICSITREEYFGSNEKKAYRTHWYDRLR